MSLEVFLSNGDFLGNMELMDTALAGWTGFIVQMITPTPMIGLCDVPLSPGGRDGTRRGMYSLLFSKTHEPVSHVEGLIAFAQCRDRVRGH